MPPSTPFSAPPAPRTTTLPLLPPAITPRAQLSRTDSQVVVNLTTLLTIPNFSRFYPGVSPDSFQPIYYTLADGSLLASPLLRDLRVNNIFLIITGCLLCIFLRNVCKAAIYLWRGKVKNKGLLYTLFLSQLLGPIATIPLIVAQFDMSTNCAVILRITSITSGLSLSLLITGILGVKAYRCLDNNSFVLGGLLALRTAATVVLVLDMINLDSFRSLSGRCCRPSAGLSPVFIVLLLTESFFICACFFCAMRKPHGSLAVRGSISVQLSSDDVAQRQLAEPRKQSTDFVRNRRGWSDVGPSANRLSASPTQQSSSLSREPSIASICRNDPQRMSSYNTPGDTVQSSKRPISIPSVARSHSHSLAPRPWPVGMPTTTDDSNLPHHVTAHLKRPTSTTHSSVSRFARYLPRMSLFREVMRDELYYTAVITAFTVVSAAMTLVGVKSAGGINSPVWIAFDWALISLLVIHGFGRVIRRHENELLLLHPSAWYHDLHTDHTTTTELLWDVSQSWRTPEILSRTRVRRSVVCNDINDGPLPSDLSTRGLFPGSAYSSRGDLHSLTASTSCTSNVFPRIDIESFSAMDTGRSRVDGRRVLPTMSMEDPPPPEPPDKGHCSDVSVHVS